jgi:chaperonin GroEL
MLAGDQQYGVNIIRRAIEEPLRQIGQTGSAEADSIVTKGRDGMGMDTFNAPSGEYQSPIEMGVTHPGKTLQVALQIAVSVASLMLTTQALIAEHTERDAPTAGMHDGMGNTSANIGSS